jgi:hypothetical protein
LGNLVRYIVIKSDPAFGKDFGSVGPDLLSQLAERRLHRSFSNIDAALWHLPAGMRTRWPTKAKPRRLSSMIPTPRR